MSASVACNNHAIINLSKQTKIVHDAFLSFALFLSQVINTTKIATLNNCISELHLIII